MYAKNHRSHPHPKRPGWLFPCQKNPLQHGLFFRVKKKSLYNTDCFSVSKNPPTARIVFPYQKNFTPEGRIFFFGEVYIFIRRNKSNFPTGRETDLPWAENRPSMDGKPPSFGRKTDPPKAGKPTPKSRKTDPGDCENESPPLRKCVPNELI